MAIILNIETATKNCSVSISKNGENLALKELNFSNYSHSEVLHSFIEKTIIDSKISLEKIDAIAVGKGPGSYTGLRIGVSAAKGLCYALNKPLISVETLESLTNSISIEKGVIIPMLDARRMEVYTAVYNNNYKLIKKITAKIINKNSFSDFLKKGKVYFLGDGAEKCKKIINHKNAVFVKGKFPSSKEMAKLSYDKFKKNLFENLTYFEPFYLKDFIIIPEKKFTI